MGDPVEIAGNEKGLCTAGKLPVISASTGGLPAPSTTPTAGIRVQNLPAEHISSLQARGTPPNTDPGL